MKKAKKRKLKLKFLKTVDIIAESFTENLTLFRSLTESFYIVFVTMILGLGFAGIREELITGYFNIFLTFVVMVISVRLVRINLYSGMLGLGNAILFTFGLVGGITGNLGLFNSGAILLETIYYITLISIIYIVVRDWRKNKNVR